jgi:hypothetical protein
MTVKQDYELMARQGRELADIRAMRNQATQALNMEIARVKRVAISAAESMIEDLQHLVSIMSHGDSDARQARSMAVDYAMLLERMARLEGLQRAMVVLDSRTPDELAETGEART